jgi:hypothetical protein
MPETRVGQKTPRVLTGLRGSNIEIASTPIKTYFLVL